MPESGVERKTKLGDLFRTMSYNEIELENFSTILNWLSNRGNVLTSILDENWLESSSPKDEFLVGRKPVSISYLDTKRFENLLKFYEEEKLSPEPSMDEKERKERVHKLIKLVEEKGNELSIAECVATQTPLWQIREYDLPTWNHQIKSSNKITTQGILDVGVKVVLIPLRRADYSLKNILTLLSVVIHSDVKFSLLLSCDSPEDSGCFLPLAFLVDAVNKSKIRKAPIDLLLLDRSSTEHIQLLKRQAKPSEAKFSQVFLWGSPKNYSSGIFTGVMLPNSPVRAAHFILDSSADVETSVESIVAEVWCSGSNVNRRARSLLFVHQPVHNNVLQSLEKRMNLLKTSPDPSLKSSDFIRRAQLSIDSRKTQELKNFAREKDFSLPTLLWEIGTSCDLIASRTPGLGHLLFVIPYRSPNELFSLANSYGDENAVFIHASDLTVVKQLTGNIKGATLRVNSNSASGSSPDQVLNILARLDGPSSPFSGNLGAQDEEFSKLITAAEKALKTWESTGTETRNSMGARVFLNCTMGDQILSDQDRLAYLTNFMKVAGRGFNEDGVKDKDKLMMYHFKPYGLAGLVLLNPEKMTKTGSIVPILLLILKGNVSIVVSISQVESPLLASLVSVCNLVLPPGVVQFIRSPSLPQAVHSLSKLGKVPLLWIVHSGTDLPRVDDIPSNSFAKVVVDHVGCLEKSISERNTEVELSKSICF